MLGNESVPGTPSADGNVSAVAVCLESALLARRRRISPARNWSTTAQYSSVIIVERLPWRAAGSWGSTFGGQQMDLPRLVSIFPPSPHRLMLSVSTTTSTASGINRVGRLAFRSRLDNARKRWPASSRRELTADEHKCRCPLRSFTGVNAIGRREALGSSTSVQGGRRHRPGEGTPDSILRRGEGCAAIGAAIVRAVGDRYEISTPPLIAQRLEIMSGKTRSQHHPRSRSIINRR
jgi:hypothetical protein